MTSQTNRTATLALLALAILLGLVVSGMAALVQTRWAPVLLFPAAAGGVLGLGLWGLTRLGPPLGRGWVWAASVAGGLALIAGQHYLAYRQYRANYEQSRMKNPQVQLVEQAFREVKPMSFGEFLRFSARERSVGPWRLHGAAVWFSWGLDGVVTLAVAMGVAQAMARRRPAAAAQG
jgi:hypothetical protein